MLIFLKSYGITYMDNINNSKLITSDLRRRMLEVFTETQMAFELQMFHDRLKWAKTEPLGQWVGSSRLKLAIYHAFNLQSYPSGHTVTSLSKLLNTDRSTISRLLTDCHKKGFIYRNRSPGKIRYYLPSEQLLESGRRYAEYYTDQILSMENELDRRLFFDYKRMEKLSIE